MSDESCTGNVLLAFLAGAVAGAAVALLTSPKAGPEVRAQIKGYGDQLRDQANRGVDELRDLAGRVRTKVSRGAEEVAEATRS